MGSGGGGGAGGIKSELNDVNPQSLLGSLWDQTKHLSVAPLQTLSDRLD